MLHCSPRVARNLIFFLGWARVHLSRICAVQNTSPAGLVTLIVFILGIGADLGVVGRGILVLAQLFGASVRPRGGIAAGAKPTAGSAIGQAAARYIDVAWN